MKTWTEWTKKELLSLPTSEYFKCGQSYDCVLLVNTKEKHDSGYNLFAVVGCHGTVPKEIVCYMDDFRFGNYDPCFKHTIRTSAFAFDCSMHGVFRLHTNSYRKIVIDCKGSTTMFYFKERG